MVQFLRVETSDNAKTYHVGVYHVLLHHLPFSQFFLFLNFELSVFRNSLDNPFGLCWPSSCVSSLIRSVKHYLTETNSSSASCLPIRNLKWSSKLTSVKSSFSLKVPFSKKMRFSIQKICKMSRRTKSR